MALQVAKTEFGDSTLLDDRKYVQNEHIVGIGICGEYDFGFRIQGDSIGKQNAKFRLCDFDSVEQDTFIGSQADLIRRYTRLVLLMTEVEAIQIDH